MINPEDIRVDGVEDKPRYGMWHCGPNPCWVTVTHLPTQMQVRAYGRSQFKARGAAIACLEMLLDDLGSEPCSFPDAIRTIA